MVPLTLQATYPRDVRSPAFGQLGKAVSMKGMRVIALLALDIFSLCLAELISGLLGTPWSTSWSMPSHLLAVLFPMLSIQVTLLIAGSFYKPGEAWRDYTGVAKSLTLGAILLLLFLYFDHPSQLISRSGVPLVLDLEYCLGPDRTLLHQLWDQPITPTGIRPLRCLLDCRRGAPGAIGGISFNAGISITWQAPVAQRHSTPISRKPP